MGLSDARVVAKFARADEIERADESQRSEQQHAQHDPRIEG
jgi:hypothetical protein